MKYYLIIFSIICGGVFWFKIYDLDNGNKGITKMMNKNEKPEVFVFYDNMSHFHLDGKVFWLGSNGRVIAFELVRTNYDSLIKRKFDFQMSADQFEVIKQQFTEFGHSKLKINDRQGIPDEVRVRFGFRQISGHLIELSVWETDQTKQPEKTDEVLNAIRQLSNDIFATEPILVRSLKGEPEGEPIKWPEEFKSP